MEFSPPKGKGGGTVFDRAASSYGRVGPDFFSDLGALLVEHANVPAGSRMIDIGAGTGAVSLAASHRLGSSGSVLAVDFAPEMLAQLWQRLHGTTHSSLMTAVMDAARLGVGSGLFDVALSGIALQSMLDPRAAVLEMCRVLRSGGAFGISISKGWWWQEDPRWNWHATLLEGLGVVFEEPPPSSGEHFVDQLLFDMPLLEVERSREVLEFEFEDAETFWKWCWSHGWRGVMERLTAEQLDGYRKGIFKFIGDGQMPGQLVANLATADRR
jgi:O-methyltransferase/aklanonic acid methyltransferase